MFIYILVSFTFTYCLIIFWWIIIIEFKLLSIQVSALLDADIRKSSSDNHLFVSVDAGHRAVIFDRFSGVKQTVIGEGTHFFIPWVQRPIIFDAKTRPRNVPVITGSKGKLPAQSCVNEWCY